MCYAATGVKLEEKGRQQRAFFGVAFVGRIASESPVKLVKVRR